MAQDKLQLDGILAAGYGIVPKLVMRDRELSIGAKALYCYFCSHTGQGDSCFPSQDVIRFDLGISRGSLAKYLKELTDKGYVITEQVKEIGRFSHNIYHLPRTPSVHPFVNLLDTKTCDAQNTVCGKLDAKNNTTHKEQLLHKHQIRAVPDKHRHGQYENVLLTDVELEKLQKEFPMDWHERIERLSEYIASTGKKYKSHFATIRSWARRDGEKGKSNQPIQYTHSDF